MRSHSWPDTDSLNANYITGRGEIRLRHCSKHRVSINNQPCHGVALVTGNIGQAQFNNFRYRDFSLNFRNFVGPSLVLPLIFLKVLCFNQIIFMCSIFNVQDLNTTLLFYFTCFLLERRKEFIPLNGSPCPPLSLSCSPPFWLFSRPSWHLWHITDLNSLFTAAQSPPNESTLLSLVPTSLRSTPVSLRLKTKKTGLLGVGGEKVVFILFCRCYNLPTDLIWLHSLVEVDQHTTHIS